MSGRSRVRLVAPWLIMAIVLAVALLVGATGSAPAPSAAQRAASLEAQLRCPSCEDVSVADSSAPAAVAIKGIVAQRVAEGESDSAIDSFLVSRYGEGILLRPPSTGGISAVLFVPLVAAGAGLAVLAGFFWRRRRLAPIPVSDEDRRTVERALAERAVRG